MGDTAFELGPEEILEPETEQGPEEEEPIELVDEVSPEVDSAAEMTIPEPDEDSLLDTLGIEMSEEGPETFVEQGPEDEDLGIPEEAEQRLVAPGETQPEAEDQPELGLEEDVPEPVGGALEQAVLEKLSDEKLEEIIASIVKQTIEEKVERILLEAAEAAIAKEIERLKQAL